MIRACLTLGIAAALAATVPLTAEPARSDLAANAALKYWEAFNFLPPRDEAEQQRLADWRTTPLDDAARKLIEHSNKSFLFLRRGAAQPRCDWALDYADGIELLLPHLEKARSISLLACLQARIALEDNRPADALDDLLAAMTMSRHVADPIMICQLVDCADELHLSDAIALLLPKLDPSTTKHLAERLEGLPQAAPLDRTMVTERDDFGGWTIRWLKELEKSGAGNLRSKVKELLLGNKDTDEVMKLVDDNSAKRLIEAMEALGPFYEEQRRLVGLPRDQFLAQWPGFEQKQSANPLANLMMPSLTKVVDARDRAACRLALLKAAVAVTMDGQGALAKNPDPYGKGPFQYTARPNGFELRSALQINGKPVTLIAGPTN
jgi:hypothetical protein